MDDLFDTVNENHPELIPLSERMRPRTLEDFSGQEHLIAKDSALRRALDNDAVTSMIFWGPPGTGKTTLANIIANMTGSFFTSMSAVSVGIKDVKAVIEEARNRRKFNSRKTILFLDEIHRFNKAQQDAFLPHLENGTIILIGATTENPSFEINPALLSRMRVFVLKALTTEDIKSIIKRALTKSSSNTITDDALEFLALMSTGDARFALNTLEFAIRLSETSGSEIDKKVIEGALQKKAILYDRNGEEHFNIMSALHKSVRGSDPQAALYWFYRMIEGGEDPLYIARRVIRMASEDIGLADPSALTLCMSAKAAFDMLGKPEGILPIAEAVVYLSLAPKSNRLYLAEDETLSEIRKSGPLPVPMHIRNAPTKLMKELGYSTGYKYDHDSKNAYSGQDHLPTELGNMKFYTPSQYGYENELYKRMEYLRKLKSAPPD